MKTVAALLLLAAQSTIPVEVGHFDPANFPQAKRVDRRIPQAELVRRVDAILADKECTFTGQSKDSYDIVAPYAVLIGESGAASKIVVKDLGCPAIETLVGQVVNELVKAGDFRNNTTGGEHWYVSEIGFARGGQALAQTMKDDDRIVCQEARPKIGSRIAKNSVCRTVAEWRAYGVDRDQLQRDLTQKGQLMIDGGGGTGGSTCTSQLRC
ncbi:MAG: hypothetical protein ACJ8FN_03590 [Sphingomicrobium sp.]|jgi:hypothetical protein